MLAAAEEKEAAEAAEKEAKKQAYYAMLAKNQAAEEARLAAEKVRARRLLPWLCSVHVFLIQQLWLSNICWLCM